MLCANPAAASAPQHGMLVTAEMPVCMLAAVVAAAWAVPASSKNVKPDCTLHAGEVLCWGLRLGLERRRTH